ncbi:MAG TPA: glycoside hydrolase/phage tail family protein, partial [Micropepsaceae bacterium]|nr:glycoside hydrolase/phage tail family protein [Micropepsaceae bacterium]
GLTRVRDGATSYPAVAALKALAADVRSIVGSSVKLGYGADWTEYNNHQTGDAPGALLFNLDPLWSDSNIDFVGIDNYMPLADWRDGGAHLDYDAINGPTDIHDSAYLAANIAGGEDFDWYYASDADRLSQTRTTITDGTAGKPWVFRAKDLMGWWSNAHYDRPSGSESATPTGWTPMGKPIWFTELGCPAVNKGANQPNVFFDPKSSESTLPYFSNGERDDLIQRRFLEAHLKYWSDGANNPSSTAYSGHMVDVANIYAWSWDARPFPFFPARADVWGDTGNYRLGHWLNGRLGAVLLSDLVSEICLRAGFTEFDASDLSGLVTGYLIGDTMSPRGSLEPLGLAFHFDAVESEGVMHFLMRGRVPSGAFGEDDLVLPENESSMASFERAQDVDLPSISRIAYLDADADYRESTTEAHRLTGSSNRVAQSFLPLVLDRGQATGIGERLLQDAWVMRETASFALPPSQIALDAADELTLTVGGRARRLRVSEIADAGARAITATMTDPSIYETINGPDRGVGAIQAANVAGRALMAFLDLPLLKGDEVAYAPHVAAYAAPWPGNVLVYRSAADANYTLDAQLATPANLGELRFDFYGGPAGRWDKGNQLWITLYRGALSSLSDIDVYAGSNTLAIENADGEWEVLQFRDAELVGPGQWKLTTLLRGQAGTESAMRNPVAAGARIAVLDRAVPQLHLSFDQRALPFFYRWGPNGKPISDATYQTVQRQFEGLGLRPLSAVQIRARWPTIAGDIVISWKRRTRIGGDSWEQPEVPLGEESENYEIDILSGTTVVRTLQSSTPQATYTLAQQTADFGGQQWSVSVAVYQMSAVFGRGAERKATLFY